MKKQGDLVDLNIDHILADEELRHRLFPVTQKRIFLAHAGVAPLPGPTVEALKYEADRASIAQESTEFMAEIEGIRRVAARLINADSDEVALLGPTSLGLNLVANGIKWQPDDEVVFYPDDYPANVYPWQALAEQGVRVSTASGTVTHTASVSTSSRSAREKSPRNWCSRRCRPGRGWSRWPHAIT